MMTRIKMLLVFLGVVCLGLVGTVNVVAESLQIVTWEIPGWVEDKETGVKIQIAKEIRTRSGIDFEIVLYPPKRAIGMFDNNAVIGMFPALEVNLPKEAAVSEAYYAKKIYALTPKDAIDISDVADMRGMKVGLVFGYSYPKTVTEDNDLIRLHANSAVDNIQLLMKGRIDAFLEEKHTLETLTQEMGLQDKVKISAGPVSVMEAWFAFQPTEQGRELAEMFSKALREMKDDGTLDQILSNVVQ